MKIYELTAAVRAAWVENIRRDKGRRPRPGPRDYLTASGLSECGRAMALDLLHPEDQEPFDDDTLERFYRGDDAETAKNARLHRVGQICDPPFRVIGGQREVEIFDRAGEVLLIRGRVEGTLDFHTIGLEVDYEIKSGDAVRGVETLEDLERSPWGRKYLRQFVAYLYARLRDRKGRGLGVFLIDRPGLPALIPLDLAEDARLLEVAEATLAGAERAVAARFDRGPMPDFTDQPSLCRRCCHLGKSCHPPVDFGEGATVDDDPTALAAVQDLATTKEAHAAYERAKRFLFGDKDRPGRYRGRPLVLAGDYLVKGEWGPYTRFEVPAAVKAEYKIVDPKGAWRTEVVRAAAPEGESDAAD